MKVSNISVANYRCFPQLRDMPLETITALIGPNDSGKTSLLLLLKNCMEDRAIDPSDYRDSSEDIVVDIKLCPYDHQIQVLQGLGIESDSLLIRKRFRDGGKPSTQFSSLIYEDERLNNLGKLPVSDLNSLISERHITGKYANKGEKVEAIRSSIEESAEPQYMGWLDVTGEIANLIPRFFYFPASAELAIESSPFEVALKTAFKGSLTDSTGGVQTILDTALESMTKHLNDLNGVIEKYLGDDVSLAVDPSLRLENSLVVGDPQLIRGNDEGTAFSKLGDGTKRRLILSIQSWANQVFKDNLAEIDQTMIFAFDEPDTHLHYEAQYELLQILQDMSHNRIQIFICTHSIPIIDRLPASAVRLMKPNRELRATSVEWVTGEVDDIEVSEFLATVGHGLGFTNSILFYERCFLIVEGETEAKALPGLYRTLHGNSLIEDGIRLFSAESGGAAKKLSALLTDHGKKVVALLDADMKPKTSGSGDFSYDTVYVGDKEFEDAFSNETIVSVLRHKFPKASGTDWKPSEIAALRLEEKFSHALVDVTICREHRNRVSKPQFGRELGELVEVEEIPPSIVQTFKLARTHSGLEPHGIH